MSLPTANYGLIKAAEGEPYDLDVTNNNLDAIDEQFSRLVDHMQIGDDTIAIGAGVASATKVIAVSGFSSPPKVFLQNTANVAGRASLLNLYVNATTSTQFTVKIQTADNANIGTGYTIAFNWQAIGS